MREQAGAGSLWAGEAESGCGKIDHALRIDIKEELGNLQGE